VGVGLCGNQNYEETMPKSIYADYSTSDLMQLSQYNELIGDKKYKTAVAELMEELEDRKAEPSDYSHIKDAEGGIKSTAQKLIVDYADTVTKSKKENYPEADLTLLAKQEAELVKEVTKMPDGPVSEQTKRNFLQKAKDWLSSLSKKTKGSEKLATEKAAQAIDDGLKKDSSPDAIVGDLQTSVSKSVGPNKSKFTKFCDAVKNLFSNGASKETKTAVTASATEITQLGTSQDKGVVR
jgi:hypothetical protein